ncbi:MAG: translocation/assembly module TamB domain-containing protein [Cyanobacteria bacterium J06573_11]
MSTNPPTDPPSDNPSPPTGPDNPGPNSEPNEEQLSEQIPELHREAQPDLQSERRSETQFETPEETVEETSEEFSEEGLGDMPSDRPRSFPWFWLGTFVGTVFGGIGFGLVIWGWVFIQEDLSPLVARILADYLGRPVELGDVENVTFGSVRVGPSYIGPSYEEATGGDSTTLEADSVIVKVDLIETLFTSKLGLDLTVIGAEGYLAQDPERGWLNLVLPEREKSEEPNRFEVSVDDVRLRESNLTLVPLPAENSEPDPIFLENVGGTLSTDKVTVADEEPLLTRFEVTGAPIDGGEITLKGEVIPVEAIAPEANDLEADADATNEELSEESDSDPDSDNKIAFATNLFIRADEAPLADIIDFTLSSINLATEAVTIESGDVSGLMEMSFEPGEDIDYSGTISAKNADIVTEVLPLTVENAAGETQFEGNLWTVDRLSADYGAIENVVAEGLIDFDNGYDLTAVKNGVSVEAFTNTIDLELPVPTEGVFDAIAQVSGPIEDPQFSGSATANGPLYVDKLTFSDAATDFLLQGQQLSLNNIAATANTGGSLQGNGQVRLAQGSPFTFQLAGRNLPADELGALYGLNSGFAIGLVSADATVVGNDGNVTTTVDWNAPNAQYPGTGTVDITNGTDLAFRDTVFTIGGGTVSGSGSLVDEFWDSDVTFNNVQLSAFSDDLRGDVNGRFQFSGTTADTRIGAIKAVGDITFSDGLAAFSPQFDSLNSPLSARVAWNGDKIQVVQASSNRLTASGTLTPTFENGFTGLESFDLDVAAQDYAIAELPFPIPDILDLSGRTDAAGRLTGSPTAPNFSGNIQLADLVVNSLAFNSQLAGTVDYTTSGGLALNVTGGADRIALNAGPFDTESTDSEAIPPFDFNVGWRGAIARGQTRGDILTVNAQNFPLAALNFPTNGAAGIGQLRGRVSTNELNVNLANATLEGDVAIKNLGVGYIGVGRLTGQISYANDVAMFTNGVFNLSDNRYTATGQLSLAGPEPTYSAIINTQSGDVQDLLTALSIYQLEDFKRGLTPPDWLEDPLSPEELDTLLATVSAGRTVANQPQDLGVQLERLAELDELAQDTAIAQEAEPLPPLKELEGPFAGNLQLNGSGDDFNVEFDLTGQQWLWGENYSADQVIAKGTLTPNVLTLAPVRFISTVNLPTEPSADTPSTASDEVNTTATQPAEAAVNLAGQLVFGRNTELTSDLQTTVQNIDITALQDILQLPVNIEGLASGRATLGGTLANPQLRGSTELTAAAINDTPIDTASALFLYQNARLTISSQLIANQQEQEPLTLSARIPYAFNFMDVQPDTEDIDIDIRVKDEGLALLNIFNQQVAWESGQGQVNLTVDGTLSNPVIAGNASLTEAVISAAVLPEPLTNVNGNAVFVNDQIVVETLQGQFSDGQLEAKGIFPLRNSLIQGIELASEVSTQTEIPDIAQGTDLNTTNSSATNSSATDSSNTDSSNTDSSNTDLDATEKNTADGGPDGSPEESPNELSNEPTNPLFPRPLAANLPLTVNLQNIDLELEDLYSGGVNGQIIVGGNALQEGPQIGGKVVLSRGRVLLSDGEEEIDPETGLPIEAIDNNSRLTIANNNRESESGSLQPIFRNLELTLGESIRIVQGGLLNFVADGTLRLSGPATDLEPDGIINIRSGRVNLFTQSFRLRGSDNVAQFTPEMGLSNPFLNVSLRASVPEVSNINPLTTSTPFAQAEVTDDSNIGFENTGSLRTIRVRANVVGPANALFENLELSSSPPRSESELIALIGGGFVTALESTVGSLSGGGDDFTGLLNLVGSALLNNVQDLVGNALSFSEFRLFPVTSASRARSEESSGTGFDIGAEAGFDVTEDVSLSIGKILTDNSNPEFGVNYRLTDSITIRANTNIDDINQVLLEP